MSNKQIARIFFLISCVSSLLAMVVLVYGSWLHDNGLATVNEMFAPPATLIVLALIASLRGAWEGRT